MIHGGLRVTGLLSVGEESTFHSKTEERQTEPACGRATDCVQSLPVFSSLPLNNSSLSRYSCQRPHAGQLRSRHTEMRTLNTLWGSQEPGAQEASAGLG